MLTPRVIPCLLIRNKGLVKTVEFSDGKYVGDPLNAVKIFNEKEVDELMVLDIDATKNNNEPDYRLIENIARECRMPLCYGGGIKTITQAEKIFSLGVEKISISSKIIEQPEFVSLLAERVGRQSVVAVLDVKKRKFFERYEVYTNNGTQNTGINPVEFSKKLEELGAGEIVINSIDNDGLMCGYDFNLIDKIRDKINIPLTVIGGAGSFDDLKKLIARYGIIGAAAGSIFVFKGKYKAVLINYPNPTEKMSLFTN